MEKRNIFDGISKKSMEMVLPCFKPYWKEYYSGETILTYDSGAPKRVEFLERIVLNAIGLGNLVLICRPFSGLRIAVCALMCAAFVALVAFLPDVFSLEVYNLTTGNSLMLAIMIIGGLAVLVLARLAVRPFLKRLDSVQPKRRGKR